MNVLSAIIFMIFTVTASAAEKHSLEESLMPTSHVKLAKAKFWVSVSDAVRNGNSVIKLADEGLLLSATGSLSALAGNNGPVGFANAWTPISVDATSEVSHIRLAVFSPTPLTLTLLLGTDQQHGSQYIGERLFYQATVTLKGSAEEHIELPFAQFALTRRGRPLPNAKPLDPTKLNAFGISLQRSKQAQDVPIDRAIPFDLKLKRHLYIY